ncbi:SDR family oxidoreductase [Parafilimonas sp.]|uniref:SDR family oxidoreductase n=1 Tax=Parafilimonas sp. TaxID=1969739 RepID=UPI0039E29D91
MPTVLILGATSDMAVAIARKMAEKGNNIQLAARNANRLLALQSDISVRYAVNCTIHEFDATDFATHASFYESLIPKPDVAICVFGYMSDTVAAGKNWEESFKMINSNYTGAVSVLNIIAEDFAAQNSGVIAGISSVAGERGRQSNYIYGSAKAGFTAYLSGLRNRLYKNNVHVVSILPGFVNTKMTEGLKLPPLLTAEPGDVAAAVEKAIRKKQNVVYVKWFWKWIMLIIKSIPENMFKKKNL